MYIQEIGENVLMAFDTLRTHKIRSALTMTGVIGGVMTVIAISSFLTGLRQFVIDQTERFGPDLVFLSKMDSIGMRGRPTQEERLRKDLVVEDAVAIAELESVEGVTPQIVVGSFAPFGSSPTVKYKGTEANRPLVIGVWSNYDKLRNVYIQYGRFFTPVEEQHRALVTIIGSGVAENLYGGLDPLGREIEVDGQIYTIIG